MPGRERGLHVGGCVDSGDGAGAWVAHPDRSVAGNDSPRASGYGDTAADWLPRVSAQLDHVVVGAGGQPYESAGYRDAGDLGLDGGCFPGNGVGCWVEPLYPPKAVDVYRAIVGGEVLGAEHRYGG